MARRQPNPSLNDMEDDDPIPVTQKRSDMLDRSKRNVGEITSTDGSYHGAHFSQPDRFGIERFFDSDGQRVKVPGEPPDGTRPTPPRGGKQRQIAPVSRAAREEVDPIDDEDRQPGDPVMVGDVNLTAWMLRQEKWPFAVIRKAIDERYSKICINETEAFDFLFTQKLVTPEQMRAAGIPLTNDP